MANLIRYAPSGTFFLRAKVGGEIVRESLKTDKFAVAKVKLSDRLRALRSAGGRRTKRGIVTFENAIEVVRAQLATNPTLKTATRQSYFEELERMKKGGRAELPQVPLRTVTAEAMALWWTKVAGAYAPQQANNTLQRLRLAVRAALLTGDLLRDPTTDLKPLKIPRKKLPLVSASDFARLVDNVRARGHQYKKESADWIEFMAYSGLRPGELSALQWEHIDETGGIINVHGGAEGTKTRKSRRVPIIPAMTDLLKRMRTDVKTGGLIFAIGKPGPALTGACRRLGLPHLRIYDLRHMFASVCNASGVDAPTFSKWLGHSDGGALAMRVYVHVHEEHSQMSAAKVCFK